MKLKKSVLKKIFEAINYLQSLKTIFFEQNIKNMLKYFKV